MVDLGDADAPQLRWRRLAPRQEIPTPASGLCAGSPSFSTSRASAVSRVGGVPVISKPTDIATPSQPCTRTNCPREASNKVEGFAELEAALFSFGSGGRRAGRLAARGMNERHDACRAMLADAIVEQGEALASERVGWRMRR